MAIESGSIDSAARTGGKLLLLSAGATAVMVAARLVAEADQPTLEQSLQAIADSRAAYTLNGIARFIAALALIGGGWYVVRTWIIRSRLATPVVPYLLAASGAITALSGVCTILLAIYAPGITSFVEGTYDARWLTGKIGFSLAGLALVLATKYQWQVGGPLRKVAPASAIIGIAMQFVWWDEATILHPIVGAVFFLWLIAVGAMLATGRTERLFTAAYGAPQQAVPSS